MRCSSTFIISFLAPRVADTIPMSSSCFAQRIIELNTAGNSSSRGVYRRVSCSDMRTARVMAHAPSPEPSQCTWRHFEHCEGLGFAKAKRRWRSKRFALANRMTRRFKTSFDERSWCSPIRETAAPLAEMRIRTDAPINGTGSLSSVSRRFPPTLRRRPNRTRSARTPTRRRRQPARPSPT